MLIECLLTRPNKCADIETIKELLYERNKKSLFKDAFELSFIDYVSTEDGKKAITKLESRLAKVLNRSENVFAKRKKIFCIKEICTKLGDDQS